MRGLSLGKKICYIYLCIVPFLTTFLAFALGHIGYKLYVPVWVLNFCVMGFAVWVLGGKVLRTEDREGKYMAGGGCLLVLPIALLTILFGMGAPPDTMEGWVATATEQKVRFDFILAGGIIVALGLSVIRLLVNEKGEKIYSQLGYTAIVIAIPLFFINTSFWHSFALQSYKIRITQDVKKPLEWFAPAAQQIWVITIGEVLLTYFAIAMFAGSLKQTRIFNKVPSVVYMLMSVVAMLSILFFPLYPGALAFSGFPYYPFMIPAVPIMLCYYIGVNLLRHAGSRVTPTSGPLRGLRPLP